MEAEGQWQISERGICWSMVFMVAWSIIILLYVKLWYSPQRIRKVLQKQGINGPKPSFPFGNISEMQQVNQLAPVSLEALDEWAYSLYPYFHTWRQRYGPAFMYSTGIKQHLYVEIPELIKWIGLNKSLDLGRPKHLIKTLKPLLGDGILMSNGLQWAFQRNLLAPELFQSKIKNWVDIMVESTMAIIKKWKSHITESEGGIAELVIDGDLKALTADVISKACFGTSYAQGNLIFAKLATMQAILAKPSVLFGFINLRFLPTKENKELWKLQKEVETMILKVIKDREAENQKSSTHGNQKDLLQIILEGAASATTDGGRKGIFGPRYNINQLILDICKNIYFAGSESTALAIIWTLLLLALHPDWQQRVRSEIMETYDIMLPHSFHDMDKLRNLKALTMVIQESLRLYGPSTMATREVLADEVKLGEHVLPKGINVWLFTLALHRDPDNWGPDAREFKPERFAGGVSAACKYPQAYIPFGLGNRICLGQNFALLEMKEALCLLLANFSFAVSPNYRHCPVDGLLLMPKYEIRWSMVFIVAWSIIILLYVKLWYSPQRIRKVLQKQGINGPKPSFPFGNISEMQQVNQLAPVSLEALDEWAYSLYPYFHTWRQRYGKVFMYSTGIKQHLYVEIPELVKWIGLNNSLDLGRPLHLSKTMKPLLGDGILMSNGLQWAFQRNLLAPEFFQSKIKNWVDIMVESTMAIIKKWESHVTESEGGIAELVIDGDVKALTEDVISKTCFGTSYAQGNLILAKLATKQAVLAKPSILFGFLNLSFLPTKENKELRKLQKEVETMILKVIKDREAENQKSSTHWNQKDLLQIILEGAASATTGSSGKGIFGPQYNINQLILDMCKNMYFAGSESTSLSITWTLLLLALHPDWQQRVRSEIMETYDIMLPHSFHHMDKLRNLKAVKSLRLYGPSTMATREVLADEVKLGEHVLPKGINVWLFTLALHRDPDNWGPDAREFKPERFAGGVSAACKYPQAYIPFGLGNRICLGQNFALLEMKEALCLLLANFSFAVSPNYRHCPVDGLLLMPKHGISERETCWSVVFIAAWSIIILLYVKLWYRPQRIRSVLQKQGINGPKPSFLFGNTSEMQQAHQTPPVSLEALDEWTSSLFPYFHTWRQRYGPVFLYSTGTRQHLYVGIPELIKWIGLNKSLDLGRASYLTKTLKPLLGNGILRSNGLQWAFQRNLLAPEFFQSKIKNWVDIMKESTTAIIKKWESHITESEGGIAELVIDGDMKALTADVISKACFGSTYAQGNLIFAKLATMQTALAKPSILFGFLDLRFLPTKENKEICKLQKDVETMILKVIKDREAENQKGSTHGNQRDLLQIILEGAASATTDSSGKGIFGPRYNINQLILDICKNVYFAGSESTSLTIIWTLLLLALHPDWQQRVRSEIMETYDNLLPHSFHDMDKLRQLKALTMVIQESLRLYGPAVTASREVLAEMKLGEHVLPKGINIWLFLPTLHRDPDNWGPDARMFEPERFVGGVSAACKYPQAYIPFGLGSRICLGQNFALLEIKEVLCLLLSKFSFAVSPNYRHCPVYRMLLMPKYGVRLLVSKVHKTRA
ncbi:PHYB activation tagged suppressor 1 [Spatholobus suberectus]|nr:PHYB activation tagged suppressor 1 [Spatholobus suberectus]